MKKLTLLKKCLLLSIGFFLANASFSQVTIGGSAGGTIDGTYATLTAAGGAFAAINGADQTGATITIRITADVNTEDGTNSLNAGTWTSITIKPSGGATRTISGAPAAGTPLINLNGADNVTINGLNSDGNALVISNTTVSTTTGTSTIRFINGATSNTITNCTVLGSFSGNVTTLGGNIVFGNDASTSNGNDNNTISYCDITAAGTNLPSVGINASGSTATTAIGNSGNIIEHNNIYDYFGAAVTSAGIYTNTGCNTWSITYNKFYQTAARTWTGNVQHSAIWIVGTSSTSGAQAFTIDNNTIGYASNTQTGTYTLSGSTGKFIAIYYSGITGSTLSTISFNTITAISMTGVTSNGTSTSGPLRCIHIQNGLVNSNSNIIGSQNTTGAIVFSTNTTTATDIYGIYNFSSDNWTADNNQIGGITATNEGASGAFILYGLRANIVTSKTATITNNLIGGTVANSIQVNSSSTTAQLFGCSFSNISANATANTVRNLTSNGGTGTGASSSVIGISTSPATSNNHTVSQNTIYALSNTNTSAATTVVGIVYGGTTGTNTIERNKISNLNNASATGTINGITTTSATATYKNNFISLGIDDSGTDITTGCSINGINETAGTNNFYFNSVYVGGTGVTGTGNTFAFASTVTTNTRAFQNNIFYNARSNGSGTGKHYIVKVGGTSANPTGLTINYNNYYSSGTGAVFGFFNSLDVADLSAWKTAVGQDGNSIFYNPQFINPAGSSATVDLHIHASNPTTIEGSGLAIGTVTNDFDNETRSGLTPTDIGADAGDFVWIDIFSPTISYTALLNTSSTSSRSLVASITDLSGVGSDANQPVLYWQINAGSWTATTATSIVGNNYTFDFGAGVVATDIVKYYIVAQDNATTPNVGSFPEGATVTANPPTASAPPSTPSSYTVLSTMCGTKTVGTGGDYATLTDAVAALNSSEITCPVVFSLTDATYPSETLPIVINSNVGSSATNTVTIKPATGVTATISGSSGTSAVIKLMGADYVTIDGSNDGTNSTNLTFSNTAATNTSSVLWLASVSSLDGATNNTIKNCIITGNASTTTLAGIVSSSGTTMGGFAETSNSNNTYTNNTINTAQYGIAVVGNNGNEPNVVISNNSIGSTTTANKIGFNGIALFQQKDATVSNNTIFGVTNATGSTSTIASGIRVSGTADGINISKNTISDIKHTHTDGWGANGIQLNSSSTNANVTVSNNVIFDIAGYGFAGWSASDNGYGIVAVTGGGYNIYHNTVDLNTNQTVAANTAAINITSTITTANSLDIRNNIFVTSQTTGTRYAIYSAAANTVFANINYNDYYSTGSVGFLTSARATLTDWQTATGKDANSINVNPPFTSSSDFHLTSCALNRGTAIGSVTSDIEGTSRSTFNPSMGAYEDRTVAALTLPTLSDITGECSATVTPPSATNSCSDSFTGTTTDALTYNTQGTHVITWHYSDGHGNTASQTQNVILDDVTAPDTPTLTDVTVDYSTTGSIVSPTTTDNCAGTITGTTTDDVTYTNVGTHTITWTFDDGNGNIVTADQNITVNYATTTWNGLVWSNGAPDANYNVTISGLYNDAGFTANHVTIASNGQLTVGNGETINVNGNLLIQSDANGTGSLLNNGTLNVTGTSTVQRYLADEGRYYYISSPVASMTSDAIITENNKLYQTNADATGWLQLVNGENLNIMQGYAWKTASAGTTLNFTGGALNNGDQSIAQSSGLFTLVGNPYPSAIDWGNDTDVPTSLNADIATMYYRVGGSGEGSGTGNFVTYNRMMPTDPNVRYIPAMQAFWIQNQGSNPVTVGNDARVHSSQAFYKNETKGKSTGVELVLNNIDKTLIGFNPNADNRYSSAKMFADGLPQIYTVNSGKNLAINTFKGDGNLTGFQNLSGLAVPVGIVAAQSGAQSIAMKNFNDFDASVSVYLEDKTTGAMHNLRSGVYSFDATEGTANNRFVLHFTQGTTSVKNTNTNDVNVYAYGKMAYINSNVAGNAQVFDVSGRLVASKNLSGFQNLTGLHIAQTGVYVVKVSTANGITTHKIVIE